MKNTLLACFLFCQLRSGEAFLSGKSFSSPSSFLIEKDVSIREGSTLRYMSTIEVSKPTKKRFGTNLSLVAESNPSKNYATILNHLSHQRTKESAQEAEELLLSLEALDEVESGVVNTVFYATVINAWANVGDADRAHRILQRMIDQAERTQIWPNSHCFSGVMKAYINAKGQNNDSSLSVPKKCEDLLDEMIEISKRNESYEQPNTVCYNTLINSYSEEITSLFLKRKMTTVGNFNPLSMQRNDDGNKEKDVLITKALKILDQMENSKTDLPSPDVYTYCTIISLLGKCEDADAAEMAESLLPKVSKKFDTPTYNAIIAAWASTGTRKGAERATALLNELEEAIDSYENPEEIPNDYGPNSVSYFATISAWTKSTEAGNGAYAAEKAEEILNHMKDRLHSSLLPKEVKEKRFQPNVIAYSSIIDCWSKSGSPSAAMRAKRLLKNMKESNVQPNVYTYTSALTCYARCNTFDGAVEAIKLLEHMKSESKRTGDVSIRPTIVSYFAVIDAWARSDSEEAGDKAEALLNELEEIYRAGDVTMKPDVRVYARVLAAYAKSSDVSNYKKAAFLLRKMEKYALTGNEKHALTKPNTVCYNTLISSCARRNDAIEAFNVLNKMDQYNTNVKEDKDKVIPDHHTLNSVIYSVSKSNIKNKAQKAMKILERLERSDGDWMSQPSTKSYNLVIAACSHSFKASEKEKSQALKIALNVYARIQSSALVEPDRFTYISLLKTIGKLLHPKSKKRKTLVETIFAHSCQEGLVDDSILSNFIAAAPRELSEALLGKEIVQAPCKEKLPNEWVQRAQVYRKI